MLKSHSIRSLSALAIGIVLALPVQAQEEPDLKTQLEELKKRQQETELQLWLMKEIAGLKEGQAEIRKELEEIKKSLQARNAAPQAPPAPNVANVDFQLGGNPALGDQAAQLILIEFTDYQCPFCSRHVRDTYPKIKQEYVETGRMKFVTLDYPLESIHPSAFKAAEATHCAADQGKFWEMHDRLFENQNSLEPFQPHANALGLDVGAFDACMSSNKYAEAVRRDMAEAQKAGVAGTPSFLLARTDPDNADTVKGIALLRGALPFEDFKAAIEQGLKR
jgi:protein-disulfide isomerase